MEPLIELTLAVLVEALPAGSALPSPGSVSERLIANGMSVSADQVMLIYRRCGLDAKKQRRDLIEAQPDPIVPGPTLKNGCP
jgi:hypothetical protein